VAADFALERETDTRRLPPQEPESDGMVLGYYEYLVQRVLVGDQELPLSQHRILALDARGDHGLVR
jgi:hypothetical protein